MKNKTNKPIRFSELSEKDQIESVQASEEKTMTQESIKSSYDFKKKSWERD